MSAFTDGGLFGRELRRLARSSCEFRGFGIEIDTSAKETKGGLWKFP